MIFYISAYQLFVQLEKKNYKEIYVEPSGGCSMVEKGGRNSVEMFNWAFGKD